MCLLHMEGWPAVWPSETTCASQIVHGYESIDLETIFSGKAVPLVMRSPGSGTIPETLVYRRQMTRLRHPR